MSSGIVSLDHAASRMVMSRTCVPAATLDISASVLSGFSTPVFIPRSLSQTASAVPTWVVVRACLCSWVERVVDSRYAVPVFSRLLARYVIA